MRADPDIRRDLERQLEWEPSIDAREIGVSVKDSVATLSGFVHSFLEKLDAERAAKRVVGVIGLANDIEVRPRDQRTDGEIAQAAVEALKQHTSIPQGKVRPVVKNGIVPLKVRLNGNSSVRPRWPPSVVCAASNMPPIRYNSSRRRGRAHLISRQRSRMR